MNTKIENLRKMNQIIIPNTFTYLHHSTSYIPEYLKKRMLYGQYVRTWTSLPHDEFVINREMSFVERDDRIKDTLAFRKPLKDTRILYTLYDYSKPFCIRVIIPNHYAVRGGLLPVDENYKREIEKIYSGYGDGRHAKLKHGEKILLFGSTRTDEISGKSIDIFYGVRECDLTIYYYSVLNTIKKGFVINPEPNISNNRFGNFFPYNYSIDKSDDSRYSGDVSEFELELLDDYKDELEGKDGELPRIDNPYKYHKLYENYSINKKIIK